MQTFLNKSITNSGEFLNLNYPIQNLYFHLAMNADPDKYVNAGLVLKALGLSLRELDVLADSGLITHSDYDVSLDIHVRIP